MKKIIDMEIDSWHIAICWHIANSRDMLYISLWVTRKRCKTLSILALQESIKKNEQISFYFCWFKILFSNVII